MILLPPATVRAQAPHQAVAKLEELVEKKTLQERQIRAREEPGKQSNLESRITLLLINGSLLWERSQGSKAVSLTLVRNRSVIEEAANTWKVAVTILEVDALVKVYVDYWQGPKIGQLGTLTKKSRIGELIKACVCQIQDRICWSVLAKVETLASVAT